MYRGNQDRDDDRYISSGYRGGYNQGSNWTTDRGVNWGGDSHRAGQYGQQQSGYGFSGDRDRGFLGGQQQQQGGYSGGRDYDSYDRFSSQRGQYGSFGGGGGYGVGSDRFGQQGGYSGGDRCGSHWQQVGFGSGDRCYGPPVPGQWQRVYCSSDREHYFPSGQDGYGISDRYGFPGQQQFQDRSYFGGQTGGYYGGSDNYGRSRDNQSWRY